MSVESARMAAAQAAIRAGKKQQARNLLQEELQHNPQNFRAWLWLAGLANSAQASLDYVKQAERFNPDDIGVRKARVWAEKRLTRENAAKNGALPAEQTVAEQQEHETPATQESEASLGVDSLREQQRDSGESPRSRRRFALFGLLLLLVAAALVAAFVWRDAAAHLAAQTFATNVQVAETIISTPTATPQIQDVQESDPQTDRVAVSFIRGQFAPGATAPASEGDASAPEPTATRPPLEAKPINKSSNQPLATWTLTPSPTFTPTATPTPVPTFVSEEVVIGGATRPDGVGPNERWIDVNLTTQTLVAYEGDRAVFDSLVSSGTWLYPTVTGQFRVWLRYTAQTMDGRRLGYDYYLPNVPYVMYFYRDYALHGTYWHSNFGTPMSHGCVNLPTPAAEWIFNWSSIGTLVNVHY